jgi:hypothetical protein
MHFLLKVAVKKAEQNKAGAAASAGAVLGFNKGQEEAACNALLHIFARLILFKSAAPCALLRFCSALPCPALPCPALPCPALLYVALRRFVRALSAVCGVM